MVLSVNSRNGMFFGDFRNFIRYTNKMKNSAFCTNDSFFNFQSRAGRKIKGTEGASAIDTDTCARPHCQTDEGVRAFS